MDMFSPLFRRATPGEAVETVGDFRDKTWIPEAQSYERLRRHLRRFILGFAGPWLGLFLLISLGREELFPVVCFLFLLILPTTSICMLGGLLTHLELQNFLCPRCGRRFIMAWWNGRPTDRCKHCGLNLGSMTKVTQKSPSLMDPLE